MKDVKLAIEREALEQKLIKLNKVLTRLSNVYTRTNESSDLEDRITVEIAKIELRLIDK